MRLWLFLIPIAILVIVVFWAPLSLAATLLNWQYRVPEINTATLLGYIKEDPANIVVFDVRTEEEFQVSRIKGAIRVDPDILASDFGRQFPPETGTKTVFYCSVGARSSHIISQLQHEASFNTPGIQYFNLRGGLFEWANVGGELVNDQGTTGAVHPFSSPWGFLLSGHVKARFTPEDNAL